MWGFRKLCVLEVWPFLILNSCVWARILAQHWSWVVQPCLASLVRWAKMPWGAERFEIHLHGRCDHVLFGDGTMCAHGQASWDVTKTSPMIPGVLNLKNRISSLTEKETPKSSLGMPSGLWLPVVLSPRHSSFLLWLLLWVFFRPEVLLLGCSFNAQLYLVGCFFLGAV